jgi:hypothetical protein
MDAEEKKQILDALLNPDFSKDQLPDSLLAARAAKIVRETGAERMSLCAASEIWQRHTAMRTKPPAPVARNLKVAARYYVPALAAAAAALIFIFYPKETVREAPMGIAIHNPVQAHYRGAADVYVRQAANYQIKEDGDSVQIRADALEARIDFRATSDTRTVVIVTPMATYRIIGTSISISATAERSALHVAEGKVQVEAGGTTRLVAKGEHWSIERGTEIKRAETEADKKIFTELGGGKAVPGGEDKLPAQKRGPPARAQASEGLKPEVRAEGKPANSDTKPNAAEIHPNKTAAEVAETNRQREERSADRAERQRIKAEREAVRLEREARRQERQAAKTERHK